MERLAQLEPQEAFDMNAYAVERVEDVTRAAYAHAEFGAMIWVDCGTGTFVSDRWKLNIALAKPRFKTFRSIRERWQVVDSTQMRCRCFRNKQEAINFAQNCGWNKWES